MNMSDFNERKMVLTEKLQQRQEERQAEAARIRLERKKNEAEDEQAEVFWKLFEKERSNIEEKIANIKQTDAVDTLDGISGNLQKLQKFVSDSAFFLPSYGIRRAQEMLSELNAKFQKQHDALVPRKRFGFKNKTDKFKEPAKKVRECVSEKSVQHELEIECGFSGKKKQTLELQAEEVDHKDVTLARLRSCVVRIFGCPSTVHMTDLQSCVVFTGPVCTSVFVDTCKDCKLVVMCQQLRTHSTTDTDIYLHVTSRAIIEDCNKVRFAPFNWSYRGIEQHYTQSGLNRDVNNWCDIDDFNWLAKTKSPNWQIVNEEERVTDWTSVTTQLI